jgi:sugar phosphate isomerase/epimerase
MPTLALSTGSLHSYGLARVFELSAEAGFDAIELLIDQRWDSRHPAYVQRLSKETALPVVTVHSPFVPYVEGWPSDPVGRLQESVRLAQEVGAQVVVTHLPLRVRAAKIELFGFRTGPLLLPIFLPNGGDYRHFLLNGLAEFEAAAGVSIGVENMPAKRFLGFQLDIHALNNLETLTSMPHLTLDTTHVGTWGADLLAFYEQLKERIIHVHLSDFDGQEHRLPGSGHLPLAELLQRLTRDGYRGAVSVEVGPRVLQAEDEGQVRAHLKRAVAFCRKHTTPH